jgi:hypothetical protein
MIALLDRAAGLLRHGHTVGGLPDSQKNDSDNQERDSTCMAP